MPERALWLQAGSAYADLRVPVVHDGEVVCFGGTTEWDGRRLTWRHLLDRTAWHGTDVGLVSWRGGDLVETGVLTVDGRRRQYEEVWRRIGVAGDDGMVVLAGEADDGRLTGLLVAVGGHAVALADHRPAGHFVAGSWRRRPGCRARWAAVDLVGGTAATALPAPPLGDPPPIGATLMDSGGAVASWRVVERSDRP
jgi:hypothetical protein